MTQTLPESCHCDSARNYRTCCGLLHAGQPAPDAESLMRSRYSAYVLGLEDYLLLTWHPSTRPVVLALAESNTDGMCWLGLKVRQHVALGEDRAEVEFIARFRVGGDRAQRLHERSRFVRENGLWLYVDGNQLPSK